jgi:hypothetical protein
MRALVSVIRELLVGDDWPTALGIVIALALTALVAATGMAAWWITPAATLVLLRWSVLRRADQQTRSPIIRFRL